MSQKQIHHPMQNYSTNLINENITPEQFRELLKKKSKYRNIKTKVNGITFDSKAEANFYKLLFENNIPHQRQVRYKIIVNNQLVCVYIADFVIDTQPPIVIDIKGHRTKDYILKQKLMRIVNKINVVELKQPEFRKWISVIKNNLGIESD